MASVVCGQTRFNYTKKNYLPSGGYEIEVNLVNGDFEDKLISNITSVFDVGKGGELFQDVMFRERNSIAEVNYVSDYTITDPALNIVDPHAYRAATCLCAKTYEVYCR
jgi:hypothetical protein